MLAETGNRREGFLVPGELIRNGNYDSAGSDLPCKVQFQVWLAVLSEQYSQNRHETNLLHTSMEGRISPSFGSSLEN
jgi:hypothetical protein